jgi:hypothetical protein
VFADTEPCETDASGFGSYQSHTIISETFPDYCTSVAILHCGNLVHRKHLPGPYTVPVGNILGIESITPCDSGVIEGMGDGLPRRYETPEGLIRQSAS